MSTACPSPAAPAGIAGPVPVAGGEPARRPQPAGGPQAALPSLDPLINKCAELGRDVGTWWRHGGWWPNRTRVYAALQRANVAESRVRHFESCGRDAHVEVCSTDPERMRVRAHYCNDRLCVPCAARRTERMRRAIGELCRGKTLSFITLTIAGSPGEPLADMTRRLYQGFRDLRRHPLWREHVQGGVAVCEIKWSAKAQRWHPHLHIIAEAHYMEQGLLSTVWRTLTGDSYIVDIRRVTDDARVQGYVTKYVTKPIQADVFAHPQRAIDAIDALRGKRLMWCVGTWYGTALNAIAEADNEETDEPEGWRSIGTLEDWVRRSLHGDPAALEIMRILRRGRLAWCESTPSG